MSSSAAVRWVISLAASLSTHVSLSAAPAAPAAVVAKAQVSQASSGCGSPNITDNAGHIQVSVACQKITVLGARNRMSSLEINLERLLLAQNPTELRIIDAYLRSWLPDGQRMSLTLEFENPRNIPIPEIEVDFLDPNSGASIPRLKPIPFARSQVYGEVGSHKFSLAAGGKTALPVAFLDEIVDRQPHDAGSCAYDASLTSQSPSFDQRPNVQTPPGARLVRHIPLLVRLRVKTIFEQQQTSTQWVWIVYGQGSEGMQFWYPSKKIWGGLICAFSPSRVPSQSG